LTGRRAWPRIFEELFQGEKPRFVYGGAMEGLFQPLHILLIVGIALLVFGTSKFAALGKGLGEGIRNFKTAMKEGEEKKDEKSEEKKS
jgi:sec-independent protein translocase protein TatA